MQYKRQPNAAIAAITSLVKEELEKRKQDAEAFAEREADRRMQKDQKDEMALVENQPTDTVPDSPTA
jgi:hypothetical protein